MTKSTIYRKITIVIMTLSFFILSAPTLSAQFKVYGILKENGKKFHGEVIEYEPNKTLSMVCLGDTVSWKLNHSDFRFTTRKPPKKYNFPIHTGYKRLSIFSLPGSNTGGGISFEYIFQEKEMLGYGGGIAFENYNSDDGFSFIVPKIAYVGYLQRKNTSPYIRVQTGYGFAIKNTEKFHSKAQGGINAGIAIGMRLSTNKLMIDFSLGGKYQKAFHIIERVEASRYVNSHFKRMEFSVGLMF